MGFLDNLKEKATDLAQSGVATSKKLAEIAKLKTNNMAEEDAIKKAYVEIGKLYYAEHGQSPDGAYAAACEKITASRAAIEANNDRIAELKESGADDGEAIVETEDFADVAAEAEDLADEVKEKVADVAEDVKEAAQEVVEEVKEAVDELKSE